MARTVNYFKEVTGDEDTGGNDSVSLPKNFLETVRELKFLDVSTETINALLSSQYNLDPGDVRRMVSRLMRGSFRRGGTMMKETFPLLPPKPVTLAQKIAYGLGHIQNDLSAAMWFSYTLGFLKLVTSNNVLSGILIMTGQLLDAAATPIAGYILDKTHNKKKWHFIGSIASCGSFPLIYMICTLCNQDSTWEGLYRGVFISVFQISWAFVQISHLSIIPQLSKNTKEKSELTAYRYAASMIANIILYLITLYCFYGTATGETTLFSASDNERFFSADATWCAMFRVEIAVSITAIGLLTSTVFHLIIKTKEPTIEDTESRNVISCTTTNGDIFKVAAIYTSSRLYVTATIEYMVLYLNETVLSNKETIATIPLTMFALSALTSLFFKHVIRVNNQKITFFIGWIFCIAGCLTIFMRNGRSDDVMDLFTASTLFGTGSALTLVVSLSFAANLANTDGKEGFVFGTVVFADKAMNGIAVLLIEYLKCDDPVLCESYYKNVMVFFNGCVITGGLIFVWFMPLHIAEFNRTTQT